jgi:hypothetical protein
MNTFHDTYKLPIYIKMICLIFSDVEENFRPKTNNTKQKLFFCVKHLFCEENSRSA